MILNIRHTSKQIGKMFKMSHTVLNIRHTSESTGRNAQIVLVLTNGKAGCVHAPGFIQSQSSSAHPKRKFKEKCKLAVSAEHERNREDS